MNSRCPTPTANSCPPDQLLLPGAPLADVLDADSLSGPSTPPSWTGFGADALRAGRVGWGFTVLRADLPTGPEHDLDDEDAWWDTLADDPETLIAVRDLDLVDPDRWAQALTLLAAEPDTASALGDRTGYTAWWLRTHAEIDGHPLGLLRAADDDTFAACSTSSTTPTPRRSRRRSPRGPSTTTRSPPCCWTVSPTPRARPAPTSWSVPTGCSPTPPGAGCSTSTTWTCPRRCAA